MVKYLVKPGSGICSSLATRAAALTSPCTLFPTKRCSPCSCGRRWPSELVHLPLESSPNCSSHHTALLPEPCLVLIVTLFLFIVTSLQVTIVMVKRT